MYQYTYDLDRNLVAYLDSESNELKIVVANLKTGAKQELEMSAECESAIPTYCVQEIRFRGNELEYHLSKSSTNDELEIKSIKLKNVLQEQIDSMPNQRQSEAVNKRSTLSCQSSYRWGAYGEY